MKKLIGPGVEVIEIIHILINDMSDNTEEMTNFYAPKFYRSVNHRNTKIESTKIFARDHNLIFIPVFSRIGGNFVIPRSA